MENKKEQIELQDYCYRIDEMRDQMLQSLMNIEKILTQQNRLMDFVKEGIKNDTDEEKQSYEEFLKETETQNQKLEEQKTILSKRIGILALILEKCKDNKENAELISLLCEALGIFQ